MPRLRRFLSPAVVASVTLMWALIAGPVDVASGGPVSCGGGTLDIGATSDTPFTLPTFNVGQRTTLSAVTTGFSAATFSWTISGPTIKDYNDNLGTQQSPPPATPLPWSTTPLAAADLATSTVSFYWKPSPAQTHPLLGPPEPRAVSLTVTLSGGASCTSSTTFTIERNMTNVDKQPEDLYTSTHRAPTTTNTGFGRVVDEHIFWHQFVGGGADGSWLQFLAWHAYFLRRFDDWRAEFGYDRVAPWYPGRPLPTGPAFDHPASLRQVYNADNNRLPTWFTIAGGTAARPPDASGTPSGQQKIIDFATLNNFSDAFEGTFHGQVHCRIGSSNPALNDFFSTSGPFFGSMCKATSPKDPMFWRWHGFIDLMYRNFCRVKNLTCHSTPDPTTDAWMGDNDPDIAAVGNVPSPAPRWLSPDIWNRRTAVTTDACIPRIPPPHLTTVGGVTRDCGTAADHENPVSGVTNFLYATLRNTRPGATRIAYAEVAVYIANASTGLAWPADFTLLPESRQLITIHLEPGETTDIGPLPWTPPAPTTSDHWCLYIRVLSVQEAAAVETANVDSNVANSNSIAWRNVKVVPPGQGRTTSRFTMRNIREGEERLALQIELAPELLKTGQVTLVLDPPLQSALEAGGAKFDGVEMRKPNLLVITTPKARIDGFLLKPRAQGSLTLELTSTAPNKIEADVHITQLSAKGADGGVTLRIGRPPGQK
jgi:Common central domain of tyrosinase